MVQHNTQDPKQVIDSLCPRGVVHLVLRDTCNSSYDQALVSGHNKYASPYVHTRCHNRIYHGVENTCRDHSCSRQAMHHDERSVDISVFTRIVQVV